VGLRILALAIATGAAATASAQTAPYGGSVGTGTAGVAAGAAAPINRFTPTLDTRVTWTDNGNASADDSRAEWVFELSPGVEILRESGRATGEFRGRFRNVQHVHNLFASRDSDRGTSYIDLQGAGQYEAIENRLFIDADASISRSNTSVFAGRYADDPLSDNEDNEIRIYSIGPRLNFELGDSTRGTVRYLMRWFDGGEGSLSDQEVGTLTAQLGNPTAYRRLGWGLDYERTDTTYTDAVEQDFMQEIGRATLYFTATPELRLRAIAGRETNDYSVRDGESENIYGAGFDWRPSGRTSLTATFEARLFGNGYDVQFSHRMPKLGWLPSSRWDIAFVRDITSQIETLAGGYVLDPVFQSLLTLFDDPLFIAIFPDADVRRDRLVQLYQELGGQLNPVRSNLYYLERSARGGVSLIGARNVLTLTVERSDRERLNTLGGFSFGDDLSIFERIETSSGVLSLSHRLSGVSSLRASLLFEDSEGDGGIGGTQLQTERTVASIGLTTRLGAYTVGGLSYRHQRSNSDESEFEFTENAITASLAMRF
jgi:uncharacterized protein (PEP-CTERM system associated)